MTEEIIIDGVNVVGCIYYKQECIANCGMFALGDFKCEGQICLYKQLKRLEQENNSLQAQLNNITVQSNNTITVLEQENAEWKKATEGLLKVQCTLTDSCKKYRSVLEEINRTLLGVRGLSIHCDKQIIKVKSIINEVLKCVVN